jgi:CHAT domain-containing protein
VKTLALAVIALCSYVSACSHEDTKDFNVWRRTEAPRLNAASEWRPCEELPLKPGQLVAQVNCGAPPAAADDVCPDPDFLNTRDDALRVLAAQPRCTDVAIVALSRVSPADLAAAYYMRAQREDNPSDFLRAADAAARAPENPISLFNRALSFEALGLSGDAIAAWDAFLRLENGSRWADEARVRRKKLLASDSLDEWNQDSGLLRLALRANDRTTIARIVHRYPSAVQKLMEDELLPEDVAGAEKIAAELFQLNRDPFAVDVVKAFSRTADRQSLVDGHGLYRKARFLERSFLPKQSRVEYKRAADLLALGGSPLALVAKLRSGASDEVAAEAKSRGYTRLAARSSATLGFSKTYDYEYVTALEEYDAALIAYEQIHDGEGIAATYTRLSGLHRLMGDAEGAWDLAFQALRHASDQTEAQERHLLLGETAHAAVALGYPGVGARYMNAAIARIRKELANTPPENLDVLRQLRQNLAIAWREHAVIQLALGAYTTAESDLREAVALTQDSGADDDNRRELLTRLRNVEGQAALLQSDPDNAAAKFSEALKTAGGDNFPTFIAALHMQRAEAHRRANRYAEAEADMKRALAELRQEETQQLEERKRGKHEELWPPYFSRFQDYYARLIGQLASERRYDEAFTYAEKARAFELLDLVRQLPFIPKPFRELTADGQSANLKQIQAALEPGTYLMEYSVLDGGTYVWIISNSGFRVVRQRATRVQVERWTSALQAAAARRDRPAFEAAVRPPYDELIATPLSVLKRMSGGAAPKRIVIVPDGAMHGLPFSALRGYQTPFLIEEAPLAIAGSATLYLYSLARDASLTIMRPTALAVGDPAFASNLPLAAGMNRLEGAEDEARDVGQLYAPDAEVLLGKQATVSEFLSLARTKTIVHVAAHARPNPSEPSRSFLLFAPAGQHEGILDAEELLARLNLDQTKLVVLAACSSAGGLPVGPEGVAPLVRPLLAAGVPAVVGTLWDVDDATAKGLMVSFHRHYREGHDVTVALQKAQLEMIRSTNAGQQSPFTWAPFQVIGHADSPFRPTHQN